MDIIEHPLQPIPRQLKGAGREDQILVSIEIGNGQIGGSKVTVEQQVIARGNLTEPTLLGKADALEGKEISIETNILDVHAFTNFCVFTTTFYNQEHKVLFSRVDQGEAPDGGIASFTGKYLLLLVLFVTVSVAPTSLLFAQQSFNEIQFTELETPSSPGLILFDQAPSSIEKPTTPQGVGISLLGFLQGAGGALELTPFWLTTHPQLTAEKMYKNPVPIRYNLSVSAATFKTDSTTVLAGGIRTRLFQWYDSGKIKALDSVKAELEIALADLDIQKIKQLQTLYSSWISKPVFTVDVAAAWGGNSATNSFDDLRLNRWATWLSLSYRPRGDDLYVTLLTRFVHQQTSESYQLPNDQLLDVGTQFNYDLSPITLSVEYLQRFYTATPTDTNFRLALICSYHLIDNVYVLVSLGKNYSETNHIIAQAGINFGFSKSTLQAFD